MIACKRSLATIVAAFALLTFVGSAIAPQTTHAAQVSRVSVITGILQPGFGTDGSNLALMTSRYGVVNVAVTSSTLVFRRLNGVASGYDELSAGDTLQVYGTISSTAGTTPTMTASLIKDFSIQAGYTRNVGIVTDVTAVNSTTTRIAVRVLVDRHNRHTPFRVGDIVYINASPTMTVTLSNGVTGTVQASLAPGVSLTTVGVYDRASHSFTSVFHLRINTPQVGETTIIGGNLEPGFSTTLPATLTLQTPYHAPFNVLTITVTSSTSYLRGRFGALPDRSIVSYLSRMHAGDYLTVLGQYKGNSTYLAAVLKDSNIFPQ